MNWKRASLELASCLSHKSIGRWFARYEVVGYVGLIRETIYLARTYYVCLFRELHHQLFVRLSVGSFVRSEKPSLLCGLVWWLFGCCMSAKRSLS